MAKSKYRATDSYPAGTAGGCCFFCETSLRRKGQGRERCINTGRSVLGKGAIYMCETCAGEFAKAVGWVDPAESNKLVSHAELALIAAELRAEAAEARADALEQANEAFAKLREVLG